MYFIIITNLINKQRKTYYLNFVSKETDAKAG